PGWRDSILGRKRRGEAVRASQAAFLDVLRNTCGIDVSGSEWEQCEFVTFSDNWRPLFLRARRWKSGIAAMSDALGPFFDRFGVPRPSTSSFILLWRHSFLHRTLYAFLILCTAPVIALWIVQWMTSR